VIYDVSHRTIFSYAARVAISHHVLHMTPRSRSGQRCFRSSIIVDPAPSLRDEGVDFFGNPITHLTVQEPHETLEVRATARVEVALNALPNLELSMPWENVIGLLEGVHDANTLDASQYVYDSPYVVANDDIYALAIESFAPGRPVLAATRDLTSRIYREFEYQGGVTDVSTPVGEVLAKRKGVCQDFAHLEIACLRSLGLPARYVSGYLLTHPPPGREKLVGTDASHAWISAWCPELGWIDFDPTNDVVPDGEHVTLAWGRDYGDVSPINGFMVGGDSHEVKVMVDVLPVAAT
jgi:transglutaminase-like putative cysteine protease